jgi:hypothetical protein
MLVSRCGRLTEIGVVLAVLGIFALQPGMKFFVVSSPAVSAVRVGVVADVEEPARAGRAIRSGAMRSRTVDIREFRRDTL